MIIFVGLYLLACFSDDTYSYSTSNRAKIEYRQIEEKYWVQSISLKFKKKSVLLRLNTIAQKQRNKIGNETNKKKKPQLKNILQRNYYFFYCKIFPVHWNAELIIAINLFISKFAYIVDFLR